jgi:hypothetical protein
VRERLLRIEKALVEIRDENLMYQNEEEVEIFQEIVKILGLVRRVLKGVE